MIKFYQSPLLLFATGFISSGIFYLVHFLFIKNSWGLLYALPAMIIGGSMLLFHYLLRSFFRTRIKHQVITEAILLLLGILVFYLLLYH